jgi:hypothetical protein
MEKNYFGAIFELLISLILFLCVNFFHKYFIDHRAWEWWSLPALVFATTFGIISNTFAIFDYNQPHWYRARRTTSDIKHLDKSNRSSYF